ncbi:MAG: hypothetical protein LBP24_03155 [Coriobacteriales bacterium]|jgi:hypothetical protein|nr:hypothetical protein [Coriobacteriales bacterium]
MDTRSQKPLAIRVLTSRVAWTLVFAVLISAVLIWGSGGLSGTVTDRQAQFVADSVRRSAIQCYAIEGRFPPTIGGVEYLRNNYGLTIDSRRYAVYYESMGDNLIPQIWVVPISQDAPAHDIADFLGLPGGTGQGGVQ